MILLLCTTNNKKILNFANPELKTPSSLINKPTNNNYTFFEISNFATWIKQNKPIFCSINSTKTSLFDNEHRVFQIIVLFLPFCISFFPKCLQWIRSFIVNKISSSIDQIVSTRRSCISESSVTSRYNHLLLGTV